MYTCIAMTGLGGVSCFIPPKVFEKGQMILKEWAELVQEMTRACLQKDTSQSVFFPHTKAMYVFMSEDYSWIILTHNVRNHSMWTYSTANVNSTFPYNSTFPPAYLCTPVTSYQWQPYFEGHKGQIFRKKNYHLLKQNTIQEWKANNKNLRNSYPLKSVHLFPRLELVYIPHNFHSYI